MGRKNKRTIFSEILKEVNGKISTKIIDANDGNKYSKTYTVKDLMKTHFFMQLNQGSGLRDSKSKFDSSRKLQKEFKMPSVSQLSRMNSTKSIDMFRSLFLHMLDKTSKDLNRTKCVNTIMNIKIIDSTVLTIGKGLAPSLYSEGDLSAIRISTELSREQLLPEKITIVPAKVGERNAIENYIDDLTAVYLFDRGYCKYKWYDEMTDKGHRFVSRQHPTTVTEEYKSYYTGVDNLYDYDVTMGTEYSRNKTRHKYREILSFTKESDEEFRLVTNIFDLTAEEIVSLYKMRWDIECFFKWVKQHLSIKKWVGYNLNAISIQIYCALIIYLLLLMLKSKCKYNGSLYDLLRKIRVNLLETFAFKTILSG